jgi:hypothetical protein
MASSASVRQRDVDEFSDEGFRGLRKREIVAQRLQNRSPWSAATVRRFFEIADKSAHSKSNLTPPLQFAA